MEAGACPNPLGFYEILIMMDEKGSYINEKKLFCLYKSYEYAIIYVIYAHD